MGDLERKKRRVIGEALARAMFDAPLHTLRSLNQNGFSHTAAMEIARRTVRELHHAGWQPKETGARGVRNLEDEICMALSMIDCSRLASQSPEWSKEHRDKATQAICAVLGWSKIVLVRRNS